MSTAARDARASLSGVPSVRLWVCDLQEKFAPAITGFDHVAHNCATLMRAMHAIVDSSPSLEVSAYITEQVPEKLGSTVASVRDAASASGLRAHTRAKTTFSMYPTFADDEDVMGDHHVIVGIESHVCVLQTVLDLLTRDKVVFVCVDAVSSIRLEDRAVALRRMERAGAILTCTESVVFELLGDAAHPGFRGASAAVREGAKTKPSSAPLPPA
jgi:hypothetical protein